MRFSDRDLTDIQRHVDHVRDYLATRNLTLNVSSDMRAFKEFLLEQDQTHGVPSTHDIDRSYLHPENCFWTFLSTKKERIIACHAQRLVIADNFLELCRTHTAYENLVPKLDHYNLSLYEDAKTLPIQGRILIGGGLWIHPKWRGGSLLIYARANRSISLRHFLLDWVVGFMHLTDRRRKMALHGYAYAHAVPFLRGIYPPHGVEQNIQLVFSSRAELLAQIRHELNGFTTATAA
jgi:hypothetical protein